MRIGIDAFGGGCIRFRKTGLGEIEGKVVVIVGSGAGATIIG